MVRRKIGEALTDANGVASITYTGVGAGKLQLIAKCGEIESEIRNIYDCLLYDAGISSNYNNSAWINTGSNAVNRSRGTSYTTISKQTEASAALTYINRALVDGDTIEMDVYVDGEENSKFIDFRVGSSGKINVYTNHADVGVGEWVHLVFTLDIHDGATEIIMTSDNGSAKFNCNCEINRFYFNCLNVNEIRFKNVMVY